MQKENLKGESFWWRWDLSPNGRVKHADIPVVIFVINHLPKCYLTLDIYQFDFVRGVND